MAVPSVLSDSYDALLTTTAIVLTLAVSNSLSVGSIPELISVLRSNPGKYAWTSGPTLPRYVFASFLASRQASQSRTGDRS